MVVLSENRMKHINTVSEGSADFIMVKQVIPLRCVQLQQAGVVRSVTTAVYERICVCQCVQLQQVGVVRSVNAAVYERVCVWQC
jgi:hypothetical protein